VESRVNSLIYAESDGVISKLHIPLGGHVRRGGKLVTIKHTDPVYQYAPMILTSPVEGIVSQVPVTEGSTIKKDDLVVAVTDPNQVRIIIEIAASDLQSFKTGMTGTFQVSGSAEKIPATVKGLSPFVDPATGTAKCELVVDQKEVIKLPPGSVGEAHFSINERRGFVFPENAIVYRGRDTFVRIVTGNTAKKIPVTLGRRQRGNVEILTGLHEGDQVIERSSEFIADGDKVQIDVEGTAPTGSGAPGSGG
jgi:RND family efflux transporter MFP subunit